MFDLSMSILIIINTLLFAFEAQYKGFNLAQAGFLVRALHSRHFE